jgi:hypothetical protein
MEMEKLNNIFCNLISPPDFTAEQIAKCKQYRHCSSKGNWCGHFGIWIQEKGKIITPKLVIPGVKGQGIRISRPPNPDPKLLKIKPDLVIKNHLQGTMKQ